MADRSKVLHYSKRKEYDLIKKLEDLGVEIIKHYGDREKNSGDVLCRISIKGESKQFRIDHKSTFVSSQVILLNVQYLPTLVGYCVARAGRDGSSSAAISISCKSRQDMYIATFDNLNAPAMATLHCTAQGKNIRLPYEELDALPNHKALLEFPDYVAYIYRLEEFAFGVKMSLLGGS